ncbi:alpha-L-fucosidase [Purpureocillium lavendulum]|uniref:Alpha-L-fucosidase n=1 Tax=Purpureocillium lavendulum TaxID=1247861 RepID=A0AB34FEJ7_9HYPO|nr:alpha-L-fucosidase [Purpureocillium lavendulum]
MDQETDGVVRKLLGGRTIADFARLPDNTRKATFRRRLVQPTPVIIEEGDDDDSVNPKIADGVLLRQEYFMGDNDVGRRLVKEATETYYGENSFVVRCHWLGEFMADSLADSITSVQIAPLVRGTITVRADVRSHVASSNTDGGILEMCQWRRDWLEKLFGFVNASHILFVLFSDGPWDGRDPRTQRLLQDIAPVVKRLLAKFGERFDIIRQPSPASSRFQSHRLYWTTPTEAARQGVAESKATFEQTMQLSIEEWARDGVVSDEMEQ